MTAGIGAFVARHRPLIYVATAVLTLAGIVAALQLPASVYPDVAFPRIVVLARGGTFEARDMTVAVTRPLEDAMSGIIGLRRIRARTVRGGAELSLEFRPSANMDFALSQVQGRLARVQSSLPTGLELIAERLTPAVFPMLQYELTGSDPMLLRDLAQYTIRPRLAGVPDVGEIEIQGGLVREVSVELDPAKLLATRSSVTEVAAAIDAANAITNAGRVDKQYRQFSVVVSGLAVTPAQIADIVVRRTGDRPVRVGDLGTVHYGAEDLFQIVSGDGKPATLVNVSRQPTGNALRVAAGVAAVFDSIRPLLPAGVRVTAVYDQAGLVKSSVASVRDAMLVGGAMAVLILLLFLGEWRTTAAAALTLPLALAGTFLVLALAHDSLNLMSLGGLAVAIGLIIDDAVVVVENIERRLGLEPGAAPADVIRRATDEIVGPVAGSTLTTVVVFAPLGLLEGIVGDFFRSFSVALAASVLLSLVLAMTLIPALAARAVAAGRLRGHAPRPWLRLERLEAWYGGLVRRVLPRRGLAVATGVVLTLAALGLSRVVGTGFLPEMDEGGFIFDYFAPTGTSLAETDRQVKILEGILRADPAVASFSRRTGAELGFAATSPSRGDMTVRLKPRGERDASVYEVMDRIREQAETKAPAVRVELIQLLQDLLGDLSGAPAPIQLKLFSQDHAAATRAGKLVAGAIEKVPGLVDLYDGDAGRSPETRVQLDPVRVARLGLTAAEVESQAHAALFGASAGEVREADRLIGVRARLPDSTRLGADVAGTLPIIGPGGWAPLGALGTIIDTSDAGELLRENRRSLVEVTGQLSGGDLGSVMRDIRRALRDVRLPPGVTLEIGGQAASQASSFRQLLLVLGLATASVLLVLVGQFRELRGPAAILLVTPLGLAGALAALAIAHVPFNVSSFMGLILLVGLGVKNGIILLAAAREHFAEGQSAEDALAEAGALRLRPILMTTGCTLAGLLPLAVGWGTGADLQRPLAIAVVGGLLVSTVCTLVLLPAALLALGALRRHPANG